MAGVMRHTMVVRNPDTLAATALLKGESLPDWATDLVHADNLESAKAAKAAADSGSGDASGSGDSGPDYSGMKPEELKELADSRELEVTGTGKDGNVLKGDLVAALEADDTAKAAQA